MRADIETNRLLQENFNKNFEDTDQNLKFDIDNVAAKQEILMKQQTHVDEGFDKIKSFVSQNIDNMLTELSDFKGNVQE